MSAVAGEYARAAGPLKIVALGDSLTAGFQLPQGKGFAPVLEKALRAKGLDVQVIDAGVSGDTSSGGLARLEWSVPPDAKAVIVELGANDMLRGIDPAITRKALSDILTRLAARGQKALLAGMIATPSYGPEYQKAFGAIYPDLAQQFGVPLYPFFLDGVVLDKAMTLPDGLHPSAAGVERIVKGILPQAETLVRGVAG